MPPTASWAALVITVWLLLLAVHTVTADNSQDANQAWQGIVEQAHGPGLQFTTQEEALKVAGQHLTRQETALREFATKFPTDSRRYSAEIRLSDVLAAEGRLRHDPSAAQNAHRILAELEDGAETPTLVKADAGFARISQTMEEAVGHLDTATRDRLLEAVHQYQSTYPADRRIGNLLTEIATLYDKDPGQKKALLEEALSHTKDANVKRRIADDLLRISFLGQPVALKLEPLGGGPTIDLAQHHGRVQVILFWASFSLPALKELATLQEVATRFEGQPVDFTTVSLDTDRAALAGTSKVADLKWPTHFDGKGWDGSLVRSLGINALPTVWVLDREGKLLTLNARGEEDQVIKQALAVP